MKFAICLIALLSGCFSFSIFKPSKKISASNLTFHDFTGKDVTIGMINSFTLYVNEASARYGNNVSLNAQYIKKQMDYKYGDDEDENFYIFIQTREGQYTNGLLFHPIDKFVLAGRAGINRQNHSWSYVFIRS